MDLTESPIPGRTEVREALRDEVYDALAGLVPGLDGNDEWRDWLNAAADALLDGPLAPILRGTESRERIESLIEASSLGTPEAKAARDSVDPAVGVAIARAAALMGERDDLRAALDYLVRVYAHVSEDDLSLGQSNAWKRARAALAPAAATTPSGAT